MEAAFTDDKSHAFAEKYLDELVTNWREMLQRSGRLAWLSVLLIALYFVLGSGTVAEVALAGVRLDREGLEIVARLIPPVVAFLWADLWLLGRSTDVLRAVHARLISLWVPGSVPDTVLDPIQPGGVLFGFSTILTGTGVPGRGRANYWLQVTGFVNGLAVLGGPCAFLIYAYITLFVEYGLGDPLVWLGLVVTVANAIRVIAIWNIG